MILRIVPIIKIVITQLYIFHSNISSITLNLIHLIFLKNEIANHQFVLHEGSHFDILVNELKVMQ